MSEPSFEILMFREEVLEAFDAAVKSYTDGTTTDFRILVKLYFDPLRDALVKVLEGSL